MAKKSLRQKAVQGGFWVFFTRIAGRAFSLIRLIILARLLAPEDFGLMGIALLSLATLETFSETGFQQALIQKKGKINQYLNPAWTALVLRGIILFLLLFLITPYAALFFKTPSAIPIIRLISLALLVQGFANIGLVFFKKNLDFKKQFLYEISGTLADFLVAVTAALLFRSVWALAFGFLAGSLARVTVSYLLHPFRPKFDFDFKKGQELFFFGKWVLGSSVLMFLIFQGDDVFVGRFLGVTALGFYQMAYKLSSLPATEISQVIAQVTFPAYTKIQDDLTRLKKAFFQVLRMVALFSFPLAFCLFFLATPLTKIFLGEKWLPMVPAMQILVLAGFLRSLAATTGAVFYAVGQPKIETRWEVIQLIVLALAIYPLALKDGLRGVAGAVLLSTLVATLGYFFEVKKIIK